MYELHEVANDFFYGEEEATMEEIIVVFDYKHLHQPLEER